GDNCTVAASANPGYNFVNWTENGTQVSASNPYTFTVTSDRNLVAHFTAQNYVITASADPANGGVVSGSGGYNYGETCHLMATAHAGFVFLNWTRNGSVVSTNPSYSFTVTESATYIAHFSALAYTVSVAANPTDGGSVSGGGSFNYGQSCTVHASANGCYRFDNWTENGNVVSALADYTFTVTANRNLVANFSLLQYVVSADIDPADGGIVLGTGTYNCGETVTLDAVANENHSFVGWWENGSMVSSNPTLVIATDGNRHFTANFVFVDGIDESEFNLSVYPNPANDVLFIEGDGIRKVTVFNALGQVVESRECTNQKPLIIDTIGYEAGLYMLQIRIQNDMVRKQFIKQ
ncbi:MAG: T9SS type A sorting domain-containing protein, partial [Prevotellaceae bacterium]|nr:T9SS type A sorting domain-containing protein [Candidatus Colivivens equi]